LTKKNDKLDGRPVLCQRIFGPVFRAVFNTVKMHSITQGVWGPLAHGTVDIFTKVQITPLFSLSMNKRRGSKTLLDRLVSGWCVSSPGFHSNYWTWCTMPLL